MGKMISAKINLDLIKDDLLFVGSKGTYLDLTIWENENSDKFGNNFSIQQSTKKDEPKIYLGNGKYVTKKEPEQSPEAKSEWRGKVPTKAMSDVNDLPGANDVIENPDDLPF